MFHWGQEHARGRGAAEQRKCALSKLRGSRCVLGVNAFDKGNPIVACLRDPGPQGEETSPLEVIRTDLSKSVNGAAIMGLPVRLTYLLAAG